MHCQEYIKTYFLRLKETGALGHAYLCLGENFDIIENLIPALQAPCGGCGNCMNCTKIMQKTHPDVLRVSPDPLSIKIETIRGIQQFLSLKGFYVQTKIVIISGADTMGPEAANAFLKTLEEPPKNSCIILYAASIDDMLPTIVSRCRRIFLPGTNAPQSYCSPRILEDFLIGKKIQFKQRHDFGIFLWSLAVALRDCLVRTRTHAAQTTLLNPVGYEIIAQSPARAQAHTILKKTLGLYAIYDSVNINLAMRILRAEFP